MTASLLARPEFGELLTKVAGLNGPDGDERLKRIVGSRHRTEAGITLSGTEREHQAASARV